MLSGSSQSLLGERCGIAGAFMTDTAVSHAVLDTRDLV